jgi:hypothetical protein
MNRERNKRQKKNWDSESKVTPPITINPNVNKTIDIMAMSEV